MCNTVHSDKASNAKEIPPTGVGYKVFTRSVGGELRSMTNKVYDSPRKGGFVSWHHKKYPGHEYYPRAICGFCFCPTREEAERLVVAWEEVAWEEATLAIVEIKKIHYRHGMVTQDENNILASGRVFRICLAKQFKVIT